MGAARGAGVDPVLGCRGERAPAAGGAGVCRGGVGRGRGRRGRVATAGAAGRRHSRGRDAGARRALQLGQRGDHARSRRGGGDRGLVRGGAVVGAGAPGWHTGLGVGTGGGAAVSPKIAVLADRVADQIAAGEVVERPASVVKELVENALDAGAHEVRVELEGGGRTLIRVSDDGSGMDRADARLALTRHATSKITDASDLIGVATYGFRGEALPSIAAVSRFELETSADGITGTRVRVAGGTVEAVEDAVRRQGTTVTVRALFFNLPARRKFLRAPATETRAAVEALTVLALARPDVAFSLSSDARALLDVPRVDRLIDRV